MAGISMLTDCHEKYTAQQLVNGGFSNVLALGDTQYDCGGSAAYGQSYGPTWGAVKAKTSPVIGNHEYDTSGGTDCGRGGAGYFGYFGSTAGGPGGYYSFDVGAWHLIALNANCSQVACKAGSAQETWLKNDLATHPATCTLAFWHQPRFSAGPSTLANLLPFWNDLYAAHADVVLNGHKHNYQRLTKLDPSGKPDPNGIREWVVGTGGDDHSLGSSSSPAPRRATGKLRHPDDDAPSGELRLAVHRRQRDRHGQRVRRLRLSCSLEDGFTAGEPRGLRPSCAATPNRRAQSPRYQGTT